MSTETLACFMLIRSGLGLILPTFMSDKETGAGMSSNPNRADHAHESAVRRVHSSFIAEHCLKRSKNDMHFMHSALLKHEVTRGSCFKVILKITQVVFKHKTIKRIAVLLFYFMTLL